MPAFANQPSHLSSLALSQTKFIYSCRTFLQRNWPRSRRSPQFVQSRFSRYVLPGPPLPDFAPAQQVNQPRTTRRIQRRDLCRNVHVVCPYGQNRECEHEQRTQYTFDRASADARNLCCTRRKRHLPNVHMACPCGCTAQCKDEGKTNSLFNGTANDYDPRFISARRTRRLAIVHVPCPNSRPPKCGYDTYTAPPSNGIHAHQSGREFHNHYHHLVFPMEKG